MSSTAQILANRVNALRSTGPITPLGKAASSQNATKHGMTGAFRVLPNENQAEFDRLIARYRAEFDPASEHESFLVEQLAASRWRVDRFNRLESVVVDVMIEEAPGQNPDVVLALSIVNNTARGFTAIQRYAAAAQRSYYKALRELEQSRAARAAETEIAPVAERAPSKPCPAPVQNEPNLVPADAPLSVIGKRFYVAPGENLALRL